MNKRVTRKKLKNIMDIANNEGILKLKIEQFKGMDSFRGVIIGTKLLIDFKKNNGVRSDIDLRGKTDNEIESLFMRGEINIHDIEKFKEDMEVSKWDSAEIGCLKIDLH